MNNNIPDSSKSNLHNNLDHFQVTIFDWMTAKDGLSLPAISAEVFVYAAVYQSSRYQAGFMSSSTYALAEHIGISRMSIHRSLKSLLSKDLIHCEAVVGNEKTGKRLYSVNQEKINEAITRLNSSNFYIKDSKTNDMSFQQLADKQTSNNVLLASSTSNNTLLPSNNVILPSNNVLLASEQGKYKNVENFSNQSTCGNTEKQQLDNVMQFEQPIYKKKEKENIYINSSFSIEMLNSVHVKEKDTLIKLIKNWVYPPLNNRFEEIVSSWNALIDDGFTSEQIWKCYEVKRDLYLSENHEKKSDFGALWYWLSNDGKARAELFKLGMRPHKKPVEKPYEVFPTTDHCAEGNMRFYVMNGALKSPRIVELPLGSSPQKIYEAALAQEKLNSL
jgi:hypothetical protein